MPRKWSNTNFSNNSGPFNPFLKSNQWSKVILKVKSHNQGKFRLSKPNGKYLTSHPLLDLPNVGVDGLVLI